MALGYFRRGGIVFAASGNLHQTLAWVYVTKAAIWWLRKRHFRQLSAIFMQSVSKTLESEVTQEKIDQHNWIPLCDWKPSFCS